MKLCTPLKMNSLKDVFRLLQHRNTDNGSSLFQDRSVLDTMITKMLIQYLPLYR